MSRAELEHLVDTKASESTDEDMDSDDSETNTVIDVSDNEENKSDKLSSRLLTYINANARSLGPKIESLVDCFYEKNVDFGAITETWYQSNRFVDESIAEYADRFSLGVISRNRDLTAANGRQYGGVAFFYRYGTSSFSEFSIHNPEGYEILATIGRVHGIRGKIFCVTCYAPPNIASSRAKGMIEFISELVTEAKRKYKDCMLMIAGDFNQWSPQELLDEHPALTEVVHGPTRGDKSIDRSFTNFGRSIVESGTLEPLETEDGNARSDHRIAWASANFLYEKEKKIKYSYRRYTDKGGAKFTSALSGQSWESVFRVDSTSQKVEVMQDILEGHMEACFQWRTTTKREADPPWVNDRFRRLNKKRRKIYDREGRSKRWKALTKKSKDLYRTRAATFVENQKELFTGQDASRLFHKHVKNFSSKEKPPDFHPRDLFPEQADDVVADKLADHFNSISSEFQGLTEVPAAPAGTIPTLSILEVANRMKKLKKPRSTVKGDVFPCMINRLAPYLAPVLTHIFNSISRTQQWPALWKVEYVTPIPKKSIPQSPNDLRNISCTQFFSKLYESFVLDWLSSQVVLRRNQYGGVRGSGTEHLLVELWQQILENVEDPRAASLLTSIDYAKAFNRLDFYHCLKCLARRGANEKIVALVASFLSDRVMTVKIGNSFSTPKPVMGGVPQGSRLGVLLFNLAIDDFEAASPDVNCYNPEGLVYPLCPAPGGPVDLHVPPEPRARDYRHLPPFEPIDLQVLKYVDDNVINEKLNFDTVPTGGDSTREKHALRSQNLYRRVVFQAESCGMKVHPDKTTMLCISETKSYLPSAYIEDSSGAKIKSGDSMKVLGFHFSSDPDMSAQVASIRKKIRARTWALTHLGHCGFSKADLLEVFRSSILPVHDYCSCVFNSSLTGTQSDSLERLQANALKAIYGYQYSYRSLLLMSGLKTLKERRDDRDLKFARKCLESEKYKTWFPLNPVGRATRNPLV